MDITNPDYQLRRQRNAQSHVPSSWFDTYALPPNKRFAAWQQSMGIFLDPSLSDQNSQETFGAEIEGYLFDDIFFSRGRAPRQKFGRQSIKIAQDGLDHYMIQLFVQGYTEMQVHGRTIQNRPGQIVGFDLGEVMNSTNTDFDVLCVIIPRARLAPLLMRPDSLHGLIPASNEGSHSLLANYMRALYRAAPSLLPNEAGASARALLELIASAFNAVAMGKTCGREGRHHSLRLRAQQFIRDNLGSQHLTPEHIAQNIGVSRSSLYQLFEPEGGITGYVRELRLHKCLMQIMCTHPVHMHIKEIALHWGFDNAAVFTRSFKQRFGLTPGEAREMSMVPFQRHIPPTDPQSGNRLHERWIADLDTLPQNTGPHA